MLLIVTSLNHLVIVFTLLITIVQNKGEECQSSMPYTLGVAEKQLEKWNEQQRLKYVARGPAGSPLPSLTATQGLGKTGPLLLQDLNYINHMGHFVRSRIPDRVVHAKGAGAFGYFITTSPLVTKYTKAKIFGRVRKKTALVARFSTTNLESGSADTVIESRGIGVKFYTEDGNWDLTLVSVPAFDVRDPILFPAMKKVSQRNPQTHLKYSGADLDLLLLEPSKMLNKLLGVSDLGRVKNYRVMSGFSVNTFKFTGGTSSETYFVRFHMVPKSPFKWLSASRYKELAGIDPDYMTRDLYNAIARKKFPKWTLSVQLFTEAEAKKLKFNPFDSTKYLPVNDFPLFPLGVIVLNQNPKDYFNDVEQVAFNPGNLVPGIEIGPDRNLQGRMFAYAEAARYRLGTNFEQLPVNKARIKTKTYERDGLMNIFGNGDGGPNYFPNSYNGPYIDNKYEETEMDIGPSVIGRWSTSDDDNYFQIGKYWREEMDAGNRNRTVQHLANLVSGSPMDLQQKFISAWAKGDPEIGIRIQAALKANGKRKYLKRKTGHNTKK